MVLFDHPEFVLQVLGAIVQAYATLLAIIGAFYIFLIDRIRTEFNQVEDNVNAGLRDLIQIIRSEMPSFLESIEINQVKEYGVSWLYEQMQNTMSEKRVSRIVGSTGYLSLIDNVPKYQSLKEKTGLWVFKNFRFILVFDTIYLMVAIGELYAISIWGLNNYIHSVYIALIGMSAVGFFFFIKSCIDLVKMK